VRDPTLAFDDEPGCCRILISEETCRLVAGAFQVECAGALRLKGRDETSRVYRVLGTTPEAGSDARKEP
jgi:class 3 adenylate cyclase